MDAFSLLTAIRESDIRPVMATIIAASGHSYRKEGAAMLLYEDGRKVGGISPGCMEADLQERVPAILASGVPDTIDYDMRAESDPFWGETLGCGGKVRILLEPVDGALRPLLAEALDRIQAGEAVRLLRYMRNDRLEYRLEAEYRRNTEGSAGNDGTGGKVISRLSEDGLIYTSIYRPRERLVIFGAGRDSEPVCAIAQKIGFRVAVADWREQLCEARRFPGAELAAGEPELIARSLSLSADDFVLICSHQLNRDREMLETAIALEPRYIGVLGSNARIRMLFEGVTRTSNVRAPVGLDIGSEGAEEIAVSIAAELIAIRASQRDYPTKGAKDDESRRNLLGGRKERKDGRTEAAAGAVARRHAREPGAS